MTPVKLQRIERRIVPINGNKTSATSVLTEPRTPIHIIHNAKHDPSAIFDDWQSFTTRLAQGIYTKF